MMQLPVVQPILCLNSPNPIGLPMTFVDNNQTMELHGRFVEFMDYEKNSARFLHLDDSYREIVCFGTDPLRRMLGFCQYQEGEYKVHVFHVKTLQKLAQLNIQDSLELPRQIVGITLSADGKWVLLQSGAPDFIIAAWQLPSSVQDFLLNPVEKFMPVVELKCLHSYKVQHDVSGIFFGKTIQDNFTVYGPGLYIDFHINDNAIRVYAPINVKKILNKFEYVFEDKEYSFLVVPEANEILILNQQSLVSFVPSDVLISFRNAVRTTLKQEPKYRLIRNHPDSVIKKDDYEKAIKCVCIERKLLVVATSRFRVLVFKIEKLDAGENDSIPKQQIPCKTVNQMLINVCEVVLVMSILLPDESNIISLDLNAKNHILIEQENGQQYICTKLTPSYIDAVIEASIKVQNQTDDDVRLFHNLVVLNAFDSVAKLKELIKDPFRLHIAPDELYQLNPMRQSNKLNILGSEDLDALDKELALEPEFWPNFLFAPRASNLFTPWLQVCSSVLANIDQLMLNSKVFRPYVEFQGTITGKPFYTSTQAEITAVSTSDIAGLYVYGDDKGWIKVFSMPKVAPVCAHLFKMPKRNLVLVGEEETEEDDLASNANLATQRSQLTTTTMRALSARMNTREQDKAPIELPDEQDFSARDYSVTSLKIHNSGMHLVAGMHCVDPRFKNFIDCLVVFHIVENDLEVATVIELESEVLAIEMDSNGNYIYALTRQFITVLTFYELRFINKVDLHQRIKFVNPTIPNIFSQDSVAKMQESNALLQEAAAPTCMRIAEDCEIAIVSFQDGDVVAYNCFQNTVEFKYMFKNALISRNDQFVKSFTIVSKGEMTETYRRQAEKYQESPISCIPLLVVTNDGSVFELLIDGFARSLFLAGVGTTNTKVSQCCLVYGSDIMAKLDQVAGTQTGTTTDPLVNTLRTHEKEIDAQKEFCLMVGDKGTVELTQFLDPSIIPFALRYHNSGVKFLSIIRESYIVTVSQDNELIFSKLEYGALPFAQRLYSKSILAETQVVRSATTQTALDLLFFELLTKMFLIKEECDKALGKTKADCDSAVLEQYNDYIKAKQEALEAVREALREEEDLEIRSSNSRQSGQQKLDALRMELEQSYEEEISRLRVERDAASRKLGSLALEEQRELAQFSSETDTLVDEQREAVRIQLENMDGEIMQLRDDQRGIEELAARELEQAQTALEREITVLKRKIEADVKHESTDVQHLRAEHKQMEHEYHGLLVEFQQAQAALQDARNRVQDAEKQMQLREDERLRIQRDIAERERAEETKVETIQQMQAEREDLFKLRELLNQRVGDLKLCVAPKDDQISELQTQLADMDQELLRDALEQQKTEQKIQELRMKKQTFERENELLEDARRLVERRMRDLLDDLSRFSTLYCKKTGLKTGNPAVLTKQVQELTPPASLDRMHHEFVTALKLIYGKHADERFAMGLQAKVTTGEIVDALVGQQQIRPQRGKAELSAARQREYLEKSVATLQISLERRKEQLNQAIEQSRQQSSQLLAFSNMMRRENKVLQEKLRAAKLQLIKRRKDMDVIHDTQLGGVLAQILAASDLSSDTDDTDSAQSMSQHADENELETYLNTNFPAEHAQKVNEPLSEPPALPRPNSRTQE